MQIPASFSKAPFWLIDIVAMVCIAGLAYAGKVSADTAVILFASMLGVSGLARVRGPGSPPPPAVPGDAGSAFGNTAGVTTLVLGLVSFASRFRLA